MWKIIFRLRTFAEPDGRSDTGQPATLTAKSLAQPAHFQKEAQNCVRHHLRSYVFPVIDQYVERELSEGEMLATCLFIYNIGGGNFANQKGIGRSCAFLKALNDNKSSQECARKMTEFYRSAGKKVDGLLKRRWVEGAIFCGYLTAEDILQLEPAGFYNSRSLNDYYVSSRPDRDGFTHTDSIRTPFNAFSTKTGERTNGSLTSSDLKPR